MSSPARNENHPSFRIQAKSFFLTYPQCEASKEDLFALLGTKGVIVHATIGQETHEDGNHHLHALVTYERKINVKRNDFFDLESYHPNVQACRNVIATKTYIKKEDLDPFIYDKDGEGELNLYDLARTTPEEEFFEICRKQKVSIR